MNKKNQLQLDVRPVNKLTAISAIYTPFSYLYDCLIFVNTTITCKLLFALTSFSMKPSSKSETVFKTG